MATEIKFVLVASGFDKDHPATFTSLGQRHTQWMVGTLNASKGKAGSLITPPALVRFIHFDWENDKIAVYEHEFPEKGAKAYRSSQWKSLATFSSTEGSPAFDPGTFVTKSAKVGTARAGLSIVDMYRAVRNAPRASVLDFSIYSHGFVDGPVLENTSDSELIAATGEPIRTDGDLDGRTRSDFGAHMGEPDVAANQDALKDFREGFAPEATFRIFGCNVQDIVDGSAFGKPSRSLVRSTVFEVIRAAYVVPSKGTTALAKELRKGAKPASIKLDMARELDIEDDINDTSDHLDDFTAPQLKVLHYGRDPGFFPAIPAAPATAPGTFARSMSEVIKYVARETKLGYVFTAAAALPAVACFGAVPGSGGDFQIDGNKLMEVPRKDWGQILNFFKTYMGLVLDERNYGRFDAAGVATLNDRELNG